MQVRVILLGAVLAMLNASPASATMLIAEDRGGQIGHYLQAFALVRSSGEKVVIDGNCLSACTLVLGLVPRERVCATSRARLGFHAAWMPDAYGRPITSPMGTQALWDIYPAHVRSWINRRGGLQRKMIFLQGRELAGFIPPCGSATRAARSERRFPPDAMRGSGANATSQRR
jgi:hypothetical protein